MPAMMTPRLTSQCNYSKLPSSKYPISGPKLSSVSSKRSSGLNSLISKLNSKHSRALQKQQSALVSVWSEEFEYQLSQASMKDILLSSEKIPEEAPLTDFPAP